MKKRLFSLLGASLLISLSLSMTSLAGQWVQDEIGWRYQSDDGSYLSNTWKEIEGKQYYFGSGGYMLSNTTTPDGYRVGADGAWIQEESSNKNNQFISDENYYSLPLGIKATDTNIYYLQNNVFYVASVDGSNPQAIISDIGGLLIGADYKLYFTGILDGTLKRCNLDGGEVELLYQTEGTPLEVPYLDANGNYAGTNVMTRYAAVGLEFANGLGIQTKKGFYDIASNQFIVGRHEKPKTASSKELTSKMKSLIPNNYETIKVNADYGNQGDYVSISTYVTDSNNAWYAPYSYIGEYIVNTKTNTIVWCNEGSKSNPVSSLGTLYSTKYGLFIIKSDSLYRLEDGGNVVKIVDDGCYKFDVNNGRIYYKGILNDDIKIIEIAPAALPTTSVR